MILFLSLCFSIEYLVGFWVCIGVVVLLCVGVMRILVNKIRLFYFRRREVLGSLLLFFCGYCFFVLVKLMYLENKLINYGKIGNGGV